MEFSFASDTVTNFSDPRNHESKSVGSLGNNNGSTFAYLPKKLMFIRSKNGSTGSMLKAIEYPLGGVEKSLRSGNRSSISSDILLLKKGIASGLCFSKTLSIRLKVVSKHRRNVSPTIPFSFIGVVVLYIRVIGVMLSVRK
jgi:hypothetical protein